MNNPLTKSLHRAELTPDSIRGSVSRNDTFRRHRLPTYHRAFTGLIQCIRTCDWHLFDSTSPLDPAFFTALRLSDFYEIQCYGCFSLSTANIFSWTDASSCVFQYLIQPFYFIFIRFLSIAYYTHGFVLHQHTDSSPLTFFKLLDDILLTREPFRCHFAQTDLKPVPSRFASPH